jgi:SacI homology domain/Inositol phosphatase
MESGQYGYALPLIQGFVGQREFTVDMASKSSPVVIDAISDPKDMECAQNDDATPESSDPATPQPPEGTSNDSDSKKFLLTLISRRSVDRPGLRYLRRGVDEEGHVANSVETEQVLSPPSWDPSEGSDTLYSFVQYRGSIPLFFSQSPYSLKPIVMLHGSSDANTAAFKSHFQRLKERYGNVQIASLVEKKGNEARVGDLYQDQANELIESRNTNGKEPDLKFEWFDFHAVCKGMRFENVSLLFDTLKPTLGSYGWTEKTGADNTRQRQSGVLRTNCMDCLDRTNVVQSACGGLVLEQQLAQQGITIDLQKDPSTSWFNTLWADNGDSISRQYAGTAALKGDFTRTRRRNLSGALTDFGLTLSRYYNNIVNDYFAQAVIDFLLGRADENIFIDFEADMGSKDYAIDLRKVRQNAIDTCVNICIENPDEHLVAAWTLRSPSRSGALKSHTFEECILLLTEAAVYCCRMDWSTEKVRAFEKVELECVEGLARGTYITSTLAKRDIDETKNVGFVLTYNTKGKDLVRTYTRSLTSVEEESDEASKKEGTTPGKKIADGLELFAFKALPPKSSFVGSKNRDEEPPSETELTKLICEQIARQVNGVRAATEGQQSPEEPETGVLMVEEKDIVSLAEARKSTGYLETLGYSLKKLVWAS